MPMTLPRRFPASSSKSASRRGRGASDVLTGGEASGLAGRFMGGANLIVRFLDSCECDLDHRGQETRIRGQLFARDREWWYPKSQKRGHYPADPGSSSHPSAEPPYLGHPAVPP